MKIIYNDMDLLDAPLVSEIERSMLIAAKTEAILSDDIEISISLVSNEMIQQLNNQYRGKDEVTDVLSFPQYDSLEEIQGTKGFICLGDIVISLDKVREQSAEYGHSFQRELLYLCIHSFLHLLGYDHMNDEDKKMMRDKEKNIMEEIGIER